MARVRIMEYGPSVGRIPHTPRKTISVIKGNSRFGVILRKPPKLGHSTTTKSVLRPKVVKGIRQPGWYTKNYASPMD